MRHAENLAAGLELPAAQLDHGAFVVPGLAGLQPARGVPELAVRAGDEHGADTLGRVAGQDAAGPDGLVVGMGVHCHEGQRSLGHGGQRMGTGASSGAVRSGGRRPRRPGAPARTATVAVAPWAAR